MTTDRTGVIDRVLFAPVSAWPLAVVRVMLGTVVLAWAVSWMFDASPLLSPDGAVPSELGSGAWRPVDLAGGASAFVALTLLAVAAVAVIVGYRPTVFLIVAFVLMLSIQRRNTLVLNSGDLILKNLVLLLALTPCGAVFSVDRWRRHGRAALWTAPRVAPWGLRLMQLQMMVVYFFAYWSKRGDLWHEGTAVSTALRLSDLQRFVAPEAITHNVPLITLLTWGALATELALALLLWNRRFRPVLIVLGVLLHLFIDTFMLVGFFGLTMISGLMCFLDGDAIERRLARRSNPRLRSRAETTAPTAV